VFWATCWQTLLPLTWQTVTRHPSTLETSLILVLSRVERISQTPSPKKHRILNPDFSMPFPQLIYGHIHQKQMSVGLGWLVRGVSQTLYNFNKLRACLEALDPFVKRSPNPPSDLSSQTQCPGVRV
jgi:hypothetical protein